MLHFILCILLSFCPFLMLSAAEISVEKLDPALETVAFHPDSIDGVYYENSASPAFRLQLKNKSPKTIRVTSVCEITDYFDAVVKKLPAMTTEIKPGKTGKFDIKLSGWKQKGHFTVTARFFEGGKSLGWTQAAFVLLADQLTHRDPFFMMDQNGSLEVLAEAMKRIGFGGRYVRCCGTSLFLKTPAEKRGTLYEKMMPGHRAPEFNSDFKLVGSASPDVKSLPYVHERLKNGFAPLTDDDLKLIRQHYEKVASLLKDKINFWIIQEEFDAIQDIPAFKKDFIHYLSTYALVAKNTYIGLKKGNPDCKVAVLGICCNDYFLSPTKFFYSKMILNMLGDSFDYICIDAYSGNWNGVRGAFTPPEKSFRKLLTDTAALSESYGREPKVINAERSFAIPYTSAFNSARNREQADYTARSLIINKSVNSPFYSLHIASAFWLPYKYAKKPSSKMFDLGIWRSVYTAKKSNSYIPRKAVMAAATTARELAFTQFVNEKILNREVYLYSFTKKDSAVICAWTTAKPSALSLQFPADAVVTDIAGVKHNLEKGRREIILSSSPVFIELKVSKTELRKLLRTTVLMPVSPVIAETRMVEAGTALLLVKNVSGKEASVVLPFEGKGNTLKLSAGQVLQRKIKLPSAQTNVLSILCNGKKIDCKLDNVTYKAALLSGKIKVDANTEKYAKATPMQLHAPDNVYPKLVLMPEYGYFNNGFEKPYASVRLAWDKQNLYVLSTVKDEKHMPAQDGKNILKKDCLRLLISYGNKEFSNELQVQNNGKYITVADINGGKSFCSGNAKELIAASDIQTCVKRVGDTTYYECAIPWGRFSGNKQTIPAAGSVIGVVPEIINLDFEKKPPYSLTLSDNGINDRSSAVPFVLTK